MKTFNTKPIFALSLILLLSGCMPDSLTKFKKDPPAKTDTEEAPTTITTPDGSTIDPSQIVNIQTFAYLNEDADNPSVVYASEKIYEVGKPIDIKPVYNGSFGSSAQMRQLLFIRCELQRAINNDPALGWETVNTLPAGVTLSQSSDDACAIGGRALETISDSSGNPIKFRVNLVSRGTNWASVTVSTLIDIGAYVAPSAFVYSESDKVLLENAMPNTGFNLDAIKTNLDPSAQYVDAGFITSRDNITGVVKYVDADKGKIGLAKLIPITLDNASTIFLTRPNDIGVRALPVFVQNVVGGVLGTKRAKIIKQRGTNQILVEMLSGTFSPGDTLRCIHPGGSGICQTGAPIPSTAVTAIDYTYNFVSSPNETFTAEYDNKIQFTKANITSSRRYSIYEAGQIIGIAHPNLVALASVSHSHSIGNGIVYTSFPDLPEGLSILPNGQITGANTTNYEPTSFTITAKNPIGQVQTVLNIGAIEAPKDLTYTTNQILSVNDTYLFNSIVPGTKLVAPITPPADASTATRGSALSLLNSLEPKINVSSISGFFKAGDVIDFGSLFISQKLTVKTPATSLEKVTVHYNVALRVSDVSSFQVGDYVSTTSATTAHADARVVDIDPEIVGTAGTLYLQNFVREGATDLTPFTTISNLYRTGSSDPAVTISRVYSNSLAFNVSLTNFNNIRVGDEFTAQDTSNPVGKHAGYVYKKDALTNKFYINNITQTHDAEFGASQGLFYNKDAYNDHLSTFPTNILHAETATNHYFLDRGVYAELKSNLYTGNNITYTVTPTLPAGLTLNTETGMITGIPTVRLDQKKYIISAINLIKKIDYPIYLEIRDSFKVEIVSNSASTITHKAGAARGTRECKVNGREIASFHHSNGALAPGHPAEDILRINCVVDIEEHDLFSSSIQPFNLKIDGGVGLCNYVAINPYSFFQYDTTPTSKIVHTFQGCADATNSGPISTVEIHQANANRAFICSSNYEDIGGPNCDSGNYRIRTYFGELSDPNDPLSTCNVTSSLSEVTPCGGNALLCLQGPIRSIPTLTEEAVNGGFSGEYWPALDGYSGTGKAREIGIKSSHRRNIGLSNSAHLLPNSITDTQRSMCRLNNADLDSWHDYTATLSNPSPLKGANPFYLISCLDAARGSKAEIRLTVREWDEAYTLADEIDSILPPKFDSALHNEHASWLDFIADAPGFNIPTEIPASCPAAPGAFTTHQRCSLDFGITPNPAYDPTNCGNGINPAGTMGTWITIEGPYVFPGSNL